MANLEHEDDSDDFDIDEEEYTDTDLFDPELVARELEEQEQRLSKRASISARAKIEELIEQKRLERELVEFDDDEDLDSTRA